MNTTQQLKNEAGKYVDMGSQEIQKSAKDWVGYIKSHPFQSLIFGATIYFAFKGFVKDLV